MDPKKLRTIYWNKISKIDVERAVKKGRKETEPTRRKMAKIMWD